MKPAVNIIWFRRDLRLEDNAALYYALKSKLPVVPLFIFDKLILDQLEDKADRRVEFIHAAILEMQQQLISLGGSMNVHYGVPIDVFKILLQQYDITTVYTNHDYEAYATERDEAIKNLLEQSGATLKTYKDQVIFEKSEVVKDDNTPYTVFTPYSRKWKSLLDDFFLSSYPTQKYVSNFFQQQAMPLHHLKAWALKRLTIPFHQNN